MNAVNITGNEMFQKGIVKVYQIPFGDRKNYYGKFERKIIDSRTLLGRIQKKNAGTSLHAVQEMMGLLKEVVLESISEGETVNLLDLLTVYIGVDGKIEGNAIKTEQGKNPLKVKVTPSRLLNDAVRKIEIKKIETADTSSKILSVFDKYRMKSDSTVSAGKEVQLKGERLKLLGEGSAVYMCPLDEKKQITEDESAWIKCTAVTHNSLSRIEFYVPDDAVRTEYRFVVQTYITSTGKLCKTRKQAVSEIIRLE